MMRKSPYTEGMSAPRGKYRWRTRLRGLLPSPLWRVVPKGAHDCGNHEWYRSTETTDACYHCVVGQRPHAAPLEGEHRGTEELLKRELARNGAADGRIQRRSERVR